mgnify:FL=1
MPGGGCQNVYCPDHVVGMPVSSCDHAETVSLTYADHALIMPESCCDHAQFTF